MTRFIRTMIAIISGAALLAATAAASANDPGQIAPQGETARAVLRNASGDAVGLVRVTQLGSNVRVKVKVTSQTPGFHGFHIHANDVPANEIGCIADAAMASSTWFVSADGHYKSDPAQTHPAHAADMPVILVNAGGNGVATFKTDRFGVADVIGKVVIMHALPDNYANIPIGATATDYTPNTDDPASTATATGKTLATGNAGDRILCGKIAGA